VDRAARARARGGRAGRRGTSVDWAALAQDLGYHDQSHFIRDFRAQVGATPAAYARRCREAATRTSGPAAATATTTRPPIADGA